MNFLFFLFLVLPKQGELNLLTYNVEGLPPIATGNDTRKRMQQIKEKLNISNFDVIGFQEVFEVEYYETLMLTKRKYIKKWFFEKLEKTKVYGSGLAIFSKYSGKYFTENFLDCYGSIFNKCADCYSSKGFQIQRIILGIGIEIDVYNTHLDACDGMQDRLVRRKQIEQLIWALRYISNERPVIFLGDLNMTKADLNFKYLIKETGLKSISSKESIDHILIKSGKSIHLEFLDYKILNSFEGLSDHLPISAKIKWCLTK